MGRPMYTKWTTRTCKLIPIEIDRLEYLISYCLKNYYIKRANAVSNGEFVPKWKHEYELEKEHARVTENMEAEPLKNLSVTVNGQRYNVI